MARRPRLPAKREHQWNIMHRKHDLPSSCAAHLQVFRAPSEPGLRAGARAANIRGHLSVIEQPRDACPAEVAVTSIREERMHRKPAVCGGGGITDLRSIPPGFKTRNERSCVSPPTVSSTSIDGRAQHVIFKLCSLVVHATISRPPRPTNIIDIEARPGGCENLQFRLLRQLYRIQRQHFQPLLWINTAWPAFICAYSRTASDTPSPPRPAQTPLRQTRLSAGFYRTAICADATAYSA